MTSLISVHKDGKRVAHCGSGCHDAIDNPCACICLAYGHGIGTQAARRQLIVNATEIVERIKHFFPDADYIRFHFDDIICIQHNCRPTPGND